MIDPDLLLQAYRLGVFPMAMEDGEIRWFSPDPRTVLPLDAFHIPHGLKRERRAQKIEIRIDTAFAVYVIAWTQWTTSRLRPAESSDRNRTAPDASRAACSHARS